MSEVILNVIRISVLALIIRTALRLGVEGSIQLGMLIFFAVMVSFLAWVVLRSIWNVINGNPISKGLD